MCTCTSFFLSANVCSQNMVSTGEYHQQLTSFKEKFKSALSTYQVCWCFGRWYPTVLKYMYIDVAIVFKLFLIYCDPNYLWIGKTQYYCRDSEIMINGIVNPQTRLYMHTCQSDYNSIMCVYMYCSWIRCDSLTNYYVMIVLAFNFTPWCIRDSLLLSFGHEYLGTFMAALKRTCASFC